MTPEEQFFNDIKFGRTKSVRRAIERGVDVNCLDGHGWSPLMWAAQEGHIEIVRSLLSAGADSNFADKDGFTPLRQAIGEQQIAAAEAIILNGADVNYQCRVDGGCTALHIAAAWGFVDSIELLLQYGADLTIVNEDGQTPYDLAVKGNEKEAAELLGPARPE